MQLVLMTLQPGEEIGLEAHEGHDQFIRVEEGEGEALLGGERHKLADGAAMVIPSGLEHNIVNTSKTKELKLYTLYGPPEHAGGTVHRTNSDDPEH
jgi:mannose-6-phosphate isomerase-like protein (cupin superfamily)